MKRDANFYLMLLYSAFIEIRALEDKDLRAARYIADILHNVPLRLRNALTNETSEQLWADLLRRAEHYKAVEWLESWEASYFQANEQHPN
jgi:hypothetical protein